MTPEQRKEAVKHMYVAFVSSLNTVGRGRMEAALTALEAYLAEVGLDSPEKARVVTWLHARAAEMNDPKAKALLNLIADDFGKGYVPAGLKKSKGHRLRKEPPRISRRGLMMTKAEFIARLKDFPDNHEIYFVIQDDQASAIAESLAKTDVAITIRSGRIRVLLVGDVDV